MNKPELKVLIVTNSLGGGGAEKTMVAIHKGLVQDGFNSTLIGVNRDEFSENLASEKISVLNRHWKDGPLSTIRALRDLHRIVKANEFTHILVNCELPELIVALVPTGKTKLICVEHTSRPWAGRKIIGLAVRGTLDIRKARWASVVKGEERIWGTRSKPRYIPNPLIQKITPGSINSAEMDIAYVGRIRKEKNVEIAILAALANKRKIDIFGEGDQRFSLEKSYGDNDLVTFHGQTEDVWNKISSNALIIVPSEYEGDGMVVFEAILHGNPILLLDNKDLRRFELPEVNYFKNLDDLIQSIGLHPKRDYESLGIPVSIKENFLKIRNFDSVLLEWESLLSQE